MKTSISKILILMVACLGIIACDNDEQTTSNNIAGTKTGIVSVMVGGKFGPYINDNVSYIIKDNKNGSINVTIPAYTLANTQIGDLSLGSYTISNIAYDEARSAYFRDYSNDNLKMYVKSATMDSTYPLLPSHTQTIEVKKLSDKTVVTNTFQVGNMPFGIVSVFSER